MDRHLIHIFHESMIVLPGSFWDITWAAFNSELFYCIICFWNYSVLRFSIGVLFTTCDFLHLSAEKVCTCKLEIPQKGLFVLTMYMYQWVLACMDTKALY